MKVIITWFHFFFSSEYDALSRLGITDGRQFLKRRFQKLPVKFLPTCCVGESLQDQVEAAIDEALSSGEWVDILVSFLCIFHVYSSMFIPHIFCNLKHLFAIHFSDFQCLPPDDFRVHCANGGIQLLNQYHCPNLKLLHLNMIQLPLMSFSFFFCCSLSFHRHLLQMMLPNYYRVVLRFLVARQLMFFVKVLWSVNSSYKTVKIPSNN